MKCIFIKKNDGKYEIELQTDKHWAELEENFLEDIFTEKFRRKIMVEELKD